MKYLSVCAAMICILGFSRGLVAKELDVKPKLEFMIDGFINPESAAMSGDTIYVSNVGAKNPSKKDKDGWIARANIDRKKLERFVAGLNDPKGIDISGAEIYIADLDELVVASLDTGEILRKFKIKGSEFFNDIEVGSGGEIFLSDTKLSTIFIVDGKSGKIKRTIKGLDEAPNGMVQDGQKLYVSSWGYQLNKDDWSTKGPGSFYYVDLSNDSVYVMEPKGLGGLDGLQKFSEGKWLISNKSSNEVYLIDDKRASKKVILSSVTDVADIYYDPVKKILLLPLMKLNALQVYSLR